MTDRMLRAIANPSVDIIGHPTGRLLLRREPYKLDMQPVHRCGRRRPASRSKSMRRSTASISRTCNARAARDRGVKIVISTDAHATTRIPAHAMGRPDRPPGLADERGRAEHEECRGLESRAEEEIEVESEE